MLTDQQAAAVWNVISNAEFSYRTGLPVKSIRHYSRFEANASGQLRALVHKDGIEVRNYAIAITQTV